MAALTDEVYLRAERELEAARAKVRDLETFVRVYAELVGGTAFAMPTQAPEPSAPAQVRAALRPTPVRPSVSLNDPELSISDAAAKVLRETQRPMKARELAELMMEWGFDYDKTIPELSASVGGVLSREVREANVFAKTRKGVFALREWGLPTDESGEEDDSRGDDEGMIPAQSPLFDIADTTVPGFHTAGDPMN